MGEPVGAGDAGAHPPEGGNVQDFVRKVKNREDGVKLMGFGHRVYKNYDPRARIVKEQADKILGKLGGDDEMLDIASLSKRSP